MFPPAVDSNICILWVDVHPKVFVCCWPNTPLFVASFFRRPKRISFPQAVKFDTFIDAGPLVWILNVE